MILGELIQSKLYPFYDLKEKLEDTIYYKTIEGIHESVRTSVRPIRMEILGYFAKENTRRLLRALFERNKKI